MINNLIKLNRDTFKAEDDANSELLERIMADEFRIIRSNLIIEDKPAMLCRVAADTSQRIREVDNESEEVRIFGDSAVVTCRITLKEEGGEVFGQFWNTKVFVNREGEWKCVVWQVAKLPE